MIGSGVLYLPFFFAILGWVGGELPPRLARPPARIGCRSPRRDGQGRAHRALVLHLYPTCTASWRPCGRRHHHDPAVWRHHLVSPSPALHRFAVSVGLSSCLGWPTMAGRPRSVWRTHTPRAAASAAARLARPAGQMQGAAYAWGSGGGCSGAATSVQHACILLMGQGACLQVHLAPAGGCNGHQWCAVPHIPE